MVSWSVLETVKHKDLDFLEEHLLSLYRYRFVPASPSIEKTENVT